MVENTPITVYTAECIGNAANCLYPNEVKITDELSAKLAFSTDMVCARYKNNYRNTTNFEVANALPGDCDNDHSDEPADWVTPEDIADLFADVPYVLHYSRHHMKPKGEKSARPRFHIVFLTDPERDADRYTALKRHLLAAFPFFDANAVDAARFLFGTEDPQVIYHPGTITLNAFLNDLEEEQAFAELGRTITEGSRNSTMSRLGARIIKRYGDTPEAKELFLQAAGQCSPPLEDRELESIWAGKQRLYAKICNQPGYIPPDAYNSTGPVVWDTPIPFDEYDLPTFPVDALPEVIRRYVLAVAESTQTSVDMAAVEALGVVSLCSQGKYFIRGNADWAEPLNTYTVVILPPAERKSSVLSMMIRPVEVFEKLENERRSPEIVKSQMELSKLEKEKRSLVERASKGKATEEDIKNKAKEIAEYEPVKPLRLFVDDVTSEKLTSVLAENNAYTGNLLLQTKFRENHLTKVTRKNQGELPRYHATDTHEAIIPLETFNAVQAEIRRRKEKYAPAKPQQPSPFTGLITCAICGKHYRRKTTATGPVWICSTYNSYGKSYCPSKAVPEEKLMQTAALVGHTGEITAITAHNDNLLEFTLKDGTNAVKRWQDRSRAESWTAEMRRAVGEKTRERKQHHAES